MKFLLLFSFLCTSLYSTMSMATLQKNDIKSQVGEPSTLIFQLQKPFFKRSEIEAFLLRSPFFSKENNIAKLETLVLDTKSNQLTLHFYPTQKTSGSSLLPPMSLRGNTILWEPFSYEFTLPKEATFLQPFLNLDEQPIPIVQSKELDSVVEQLLLQQKERFESTQRNLLYGVNGFLLLMVLILLYKLLHKRLERIQNKQKELLAQRKLHRSLLQALKKKRPAWDLLHQWLVEYVANESKEKRERTPLELASYFQENNNERLLKVALMIQQYAYLPSSDFEPFEMACHAVKT